MDELFDVFDSGVAQPLTQSSEPEDAAPPNDTKKPKRTRTKKRKADGTIKNGSAPAQDGDIELPDAPVVNDGADADGDDSPHPSDEQEIKRRKKKDDTQEPILTDTFETAESRELTAAGGFAESDKDDNGAIVLSHNIQHQVALPKDYPYIPLSQHQPPAEPARSYPFKLDPFQSLAVSSIQRDESVLVSAHTSAGKTVVAEYAIAQCLKRNQRVIYTSPIKALSNQKYRDFESIFGDVGLMTGDVTINPTASCLVMTTEILRSMLYRGSEIMREVGWVVFDEIHYMRDKTRGVVWEETIILLPKKVRYVFLSATIPNAFQFAEWIAKIHEQPCHVVYTDFRPTPLQNYFFPAGGKGIFLVVDEKGVFKENNFNEAMRTIEENTNEPRSARDKHGKGRGKDRGRQGGASDQRAPITKVITNIMKRSYHPVIVFSFSKRECESLALNISNLRFTDDSEKEMVRKVFSSAIDSLPESDRELPQILHILPLLERGIGVHHSGLLPILKETIEILFQESLIKVLFATETFSIGLNMPAKTVVFTQVKKFDGVNTRPLTPSEYIQMSGRAGRRGLDSRGIVIMMVDDKMEPDVFKQIVVGQQDRLNSAFYLGYNMILNLLRIETFNPEYMLERCFFQFQTAASVPTLERELMELQQARDGLAVTDEATVKDYYTIRQQLNTYHQDMRLIIQIPSHCVHYLQPGRLVQMYDPKELSDDLLDGQDYGWGVVVETMQRRRGESQRFTDQESMVVDVFLPIAADSPQFAPGHPEHGMPPGIKSEARATDGNVRWEVVPCLFTCIKAISQVRVFLPKGGVQSGRDKDTVIKSVLEVKRRFPDGLPVMDPIENLEISDEGFRKLLRKIEVLESRLLSNPLHGSAVLPELWEQYHAKTKLGEQIKEKKRAIARAYDVAQKDELKARKRVLRRLDFIDTNEVVTLKARVACEISSTEGHELLLAELLFDGFFNELTPEVIAAVLSLFIFDEKLDGEPLKEELQKPLRVVQAKAKIIAKVSMESKIDTNEKDYVESLKWQLMETVHAWCSGAKFLDICKMTTAYEGSLIRLFRRLEELLRQMAQAAKVMGSEDLTVKFEESLKRIRRDIVAAQSLYL